MRQSVERGISNAAQKAKFIVEACTKKDKSKKSGESKGECGVESCILHVASEKQSKEHNE